MGSDNKQVQQPGDGTSQSDLLKRNGITPEPVPGSKEAADRIKARIDNTIGNHLASGQTTNTEQTAVTGSITDRSSFLESFKGRETDFLRNYREIPGVTVLPSVPGGVTVSAVIPASYVEIKDGKPQLQGNGVQTVDENGKLLQNFRLTSTKLRQNENGTYTITQNYNPKPAPSALSRTSVYAEYDNNPANRQNDTRVGFKLTIGGGKTTLGPYVGKGNIAVGADIPLKDDRYKQAVINPADIKVSMLLHVENTQKINAGISNSNTQTQIDGNNLQPAKNIVKSKGPNM
jgi:hypothetical protein